MAMYTAVSLYPIVTLLPPANEVWGKVMFLDLCVILFTVRKGASQTETPLDREPLDRDAPLDRNIPGQRHPGQKPPVQFDAVFGRNLVK